LNDPIRFTANALSVDFPDSLANEQRIPYLLDQAISKKILPAWFDEVSLLRLSNVIVASMQAFSNYEPPSFDGAITFVKAEDNPNWKDICPSQVWSKYCQSVTTVSVPKGTHDNLLQEPQLQFVLDAIESNCRMNNHNPKR